jgi:hypothetical protein
LIHGDEERDEGIRNSIGGRTTDLPSRLLEATHQPGDLHRGVTIVIDVTILRLEHDPADVIVTNQLSDSRPLVNLGTGKGDEKELPNFGGTRHLPHKLRHLILLSLKPRGRNQSHAYGNCEGQRNELSLELGHLVIPNPTEQARHTL